MASIDYKNDIKNMERYLEDVKREMKENPEKARRDAKEALIRTGVLEGDGTIKECIVTVPQY